MTCGRNQKKPTGMGGVGSAGASVELCLSAGRRAATPEADDNKKKLTEPERKTTMNMLELARRWHPEQEMITHKQPQETSEES